jgi:hypothetical protein
VRWLVGSFVTLFLISLVMVCVDCTQTRALLFSDSNISYYLVLFMSVKARFLSSVGSAHSGGKYCSRFSVNPAGSCLGF